MLMPKKNRVAIYEYLFKEGVMVAKKDYHASKHQELETIPNLEVIKAMQRLFHLRSRNKLGQKLQDPGLPQVQEARLQDRQKTVLVTDEGQEVLLDLAIKKLMLV